MLEYSALAKHLDTWDQVWLHLGGEFDAIVTPSESEAEELASPGRTPLPLPPAICTPSAVSHTSQPLQHLPGSRRPVYPYPEPPYPVISDDDGD